MPTERAAAPYGTWGAAMQGPQWPALRAAAALGRLALRGGLRRLAQRIAAAGDGSDHLCIAQHLCEFETQVAHMGLDHRHVALRVETLHPCHDPLGGEHLPGTGK